MVDSPQTNAKLAQRLDVAFPILSDAELTAIRAFGIEDVGNDLALPATFVIDAAGTIKMVYVGENVRDRPDIDAILAAL